VCKMCVSGAVRFDKRNMEEVLPLSVEIALRAE